MVVMSDLLYFDSAHDKLIQSIELLLAKRKEARLFVGAGKYTPRHICESFLEKGGEIGLLWEENRTNGNWEGNTRTGSYTVEEMQTRKNNSYVWIGRWSTGLVGT